MQKCIFYLSVCIEAILASGCIAFHDPQTTLLQEAQHIVIVYEKPDNCKMLGEVDGFKKNTWGGLDLKQIKDSAKNDMKNNASAMGADTIFVVSEDKLTSSNEVISGKKNTNDSIFGSRTREEIVKEIHIQGTAYKCKMDNNDFRHKE
ncbi:DUF4156 domain-containing protein [Helicobacter aurati]|uniref:DUF4156 domain-containing protein n=1 Tax=Helicobacter aurati TaxID=137778 RepID=A0A3D8J8H3_9HELI|nr:DUF4156 domain-containing protein [Helicobacter aurati]RDU73174.1 DUF4156 domain-containing protein [Helicobacter aurati]